MVRDLAVRGLPAQFQFLLPAFQSNTSATRSLVSPQVVAKVRSSLPILNHLSKGGSSRNRLPLRATLVFTF